MKNALSIVVFVIYSLGYFVLSLSWLVDHTYTLVFIHPMLFWIFLVVAFVATFKLDDLRWRIVFLLSMVTFYGLSLCMAVSLEIDDVDGKFDGIKKGIKFASGLFRDNLIWFILGQIWVWYRFFKGVYHKK
ncbi:MAG: hypothetical protein ACK5NT_08045 [Pyrinomonadaceae bacterium]